MLDILILKEMRREIVNGVLFISFVYCVNYFIKNNILIVSKKNESNNEMNNDIQLDDIELDENNENKILQQNNENIMDNKIQDIIDNDNDKLIELQNKKEYLLELNAKLEHIKVILNDIKNSIGNNN